MHFRKNLNLNNFLPEARTLLSEYACTFCSSIYLHPMMDNSGNIFCKECLYKNLDEGNLAVKNSELNSIKFIENVLDKQGVYCKNRNLGCPWVGKLMCLESHMIDECDKQITACENKECEVSIFEKISITI